MVLWIGGKWKGSHVFAEKGDIAPGAERVESELLENPRHPQLLVILLLRFHVPLEASRRGRSTSAERRRVFVILKKNGKKKKQLAIKMYYLI